MHSAAKLRRESNAAYQINPIPVYDTNEYAKKRSAAEAEPINPAAGSRDEPTRLPVEDPVAERKQRIEVQVHKGFVLVIN